MYWVGQNVRSGFSSVVTENPNERFGQPNSWEDDCHLRLFPPAFYSQNMSYIHPSEYGYSKTMRLDGWMDGDKETDKLIDIYS